MPTRLEVLLQRRKSAAAGLLHRHITASAATGTRPAAMRVEKRLGRTEFLKIIFAKLHQLIDDFAWASGSCQRRKVAFWGTGGQISPFMLCLRCDMVKSVTTPT